MSRTVDSRVVEMQFDNKRFESNVATSMSTLEKLKQSLNFNGVSKGFDNINTSAKSVNFSGLGSAVETVGLKFNAMWTIADQTLRNITNSVESTAKRMISALTIDPIKTGFSEYETQINAIQTILANTESKGTTLDDVNNALDTLNTYADQTIYNFTEMTRNIGTFTAAGVGLQTSVDSIKGIANLAAVSGSSSQQASTAMYQLSQALAAGRVSLMDWNSVVNAGMGGELFQNALIRTSELLNTGAKDAIATYGSFRESLTQGEWLTTEVLTETLKQLSGAYSEADLVAQGYTAEQAAEIAKLAQTATDAATKVKTATQLWDTLKESAQSGWTQTWETIIGDFGEAKELYTKISDVVGGMITETAKNRNELLSGTLDSNWKKLTQTLDGVGIESTELEEKITSIAKSKDIDVTPLIEEYGSLGEAFKSGAISSDILNESLSNMSIKPLQQALMGLGYEIPKATGYFGDYTEAAVKAFQETNGLEVTGIVDDATVKALKESITIVKDWSGELSETAEGDSVKKVQQALMGLGYEIPKATGYFGDYTEAAVKAFQETNGLEVTGIVDDATLAKLNEASGALLDLSGHCESLTSKITELGGRENLIQALWNMFDALLSIVEPIKEAFRDIFPPIAAEQLADYIKKFTDFTAKLTLSESASEKLKSTFKGLFAIVSIVAKALGSAGLAVWNLITSDGFVSLVNLFLDATAAIGEFFVSINEGFSTDGLTGALSVVIDWISNLLGAVTKDLRSFGDVFSLIGGWIADAATYIWNAVKPVFTWISENVSIGDVFAGLAGGGIFVLAKKLGGLFGIISDTLEKMLGGKNGGGLAAIKEKFTDILDSLNDSIQAFTSGIKVWSLVGIAVAIGILASSMRTLSELEFKDISKSLFAIGILITELSLGFGSLTKSLSKFKPKGVVKAGFSLVLMAVAIGILADAMVTLSDLSLGEIGKGLVGVGVGIGELVGGLKLIGKTKVSLSTSIAMLALAYSCSLLGDAMQKFSAFSWDEIGRGLTAMGGAIGELVTALSVLGKFGGMKSLLGSIGILIAVQSLEKMAEGLKSFAEMAWDEIKRGLTAMGGALGELGITLGVLGKIAGFSSIFAAGAIWIVIQGLDDLAAALERFGSMTWDEIGRGLVAMGGALLEVGGITGALGYLTGFAGILGAGSIWIVIQGLDDLANALQKFGSMSWDEIGRGLVAMGGALLEVGGITGALGYLTNFAGILGAGTIWIAVQGLDDLANALQKFGSMAWNEIGRGLVAMGGALVEVGGISGATGALTGFAGLVGAGTILLVVQGLDDLAGALQQFGSMSWDEIGRGLSAMGGALAELALGGLMNTLSILGSFSIATVAEPLGVLADSVKKWNGVTVPEGLGGQISSLAGGVLSFTLNGLGASAIAELAAPLGTLADSVRNWSGVTVPEGIGDKLATIADGCGAFTFKGLAGSAIADLATPLGDLATSVSKWSGVTIPETLGEDLGVLADGIGGFSFAFMAGWSLSTLIDPLADLADSVTKWNGVDIPDSLGDDLSALADGVTSFSWAFLGGWSIDAIVGPLGDLASSVKKWNNVSVPDGIGDDLKSISSGVKSFTDIGSIATATDGMAAIAKSASKLDDIDYASIEIGLSSMVAALYNLSSVDIGDASLINDISKAISNLGSSIKKTAPSLKSAGQSLITALSDGIKSCYNVVIENGTTLTTKLATSISKTKGKLVSAIKGSLLSALSAITACYTSFYANGKYLGAGLVNGMYAKWWSVYNAGYSLGRAAVQGEKDGQASNSPSKLTFQSGVWFGEGLVNGIKSMGRAVSKTAYGLGETATSSLSRTISSIADAFDSGVDTQPTIRPVLDLTDIRNGTGTIADMLSMGSSVDLLTNVGSISNMMNQRNQNGGFSDIVTAINKLRKDLGNVGNTNNYNFNGITYDDGSNVSNAIEEIVRYARVERRV